MTRYHGKCGRGARATEQKKKRTEAEERNAATPLERTAEFRRMRKTVQDAIAASRAARGVA